ncbi:hypothetical protein EJB05_29224, partial [Eragrostis curvula]
MDEAVASAALVLAYAGEGSLRTSAAQLLKLADEVARAADHLRVPCYRLVAAARTLLRADDAGRSRAVAELEKAAAALQKEVAARQGALVLGAGSVTGACRQRSISKVLAVSEKLWLVASGVGVPGDSLDAACGALADEGADDASRARAIDDLIKAAQELEERAGARLDVLVRGAANLGHACQQHQRVADAVPVVRRAAEAAQKKQEERRSRTAGAGTSSCAWWPWGRRVRRVPDMEMALLLPQQPEPASPSTPAEEQQSKVREAMAEKTSGSHGYALYGSLALLPGFGSEAVLKGLGNNKAWFTGIFCTWWSAVALGVSSSIFPCTPFDVAFAHLTSRIGMIVLKLTSVIFNQCSSTSVVEVAIEKAQGQEKEERSCSLTSSHFIVAYSELARV